MPDETLKQLTQERLRAYKKRLLTLEDSVSSSDASAVQLAEFDPSRIYFKDDPRWTDMYHSVSVALALHPPSQP